MGVKVIVTHDLKCDRCGFMEKNTERNPMKEDLSTWQYWSRRGVEGAWATTQKLLCGQCVGKLDAFLMGDNTPRGANFNEGENERYYGHAAASC